MKFKSMRLNFDFYIFLCVKWGRMIIFVYRVVKIILDIYVKRLYSISIF